MRSFICMSKGRKSCRLGSTNTNFKSTWCWSLIKIQTLTRKIKFTCQLMLFFENNFPCMKRVSLIFIKRQLTISRLIGQQSMSSISNSFSWTSKKRRWSFWGSNWMNSKNQTKKAGRRSEKAKRFPKNLSESPKLEIDWNLFKSKPANGKLLRRSPSWEKIVYESFWKAIFRLWKATALNLIASKSRSLQKEYISLSWDQPIPIGKIGLNVSKNILLAWIISRCSSELTFPALRKLNISLNREQIYSIKMFVSSWDFQSALGIQRISNDMCKDFLSQII